MPLRRRILITAGPTREMLDPIRYISNLSTGTMGYALAEAARRKHYNVTLISGPTALRSPRGVGFIPVVTSKEMKQACIKQFAKHDVLVMTAAVCDFMAAKTHSQKLRRKQTRQINVKPTEDIVAGLARRKGNRLVIGFSLETEDWIGNAAKKMKEKKLDGIVANVYRAGESPFGERRITTALLQRNGQKHLLKNLSKKQIASRILRWIEGFRS